MVMGAFLVKMPIYFFHLWLPKAHVEAPVAGSMILAGVLLKLGGYGMLQVSAHMQWLNGPIFPIVGRVCLYGAVIAGVICLRQADVKALVAYRSVRHMAFVIGGIMCNSAWGWDGAILMMVRHGLVSSALFVLCGVLYSIRGTRCLFLIKGMLTVRPMLCALCFLCLAANIGAPPSINLLREVMARVGILSKS